MEEEERKRQNLAGIIVLLIPFVIFIALVLFIDLVMFFTKGLVFPLTKELLK